MSAVTVQHKVFPDVLTPAIMFQCQCCCLPSPSFNPHPAREPGATVEARPVPDIGLQVSILTRPVSRVQHRRGRGHLRDAVSVSILTRPVSRVQRCGVAASRHPSTGFNPHPAREPGATTVNSTRETNGIAVSILTRPVSRVQRTTLVHTSSLDPCFNPHPAREPGATPSYARCTKAINGFQSSPGSRAGATNVKNSMNVT